MSKGKTRVKYFQAAGLPDVVYKILQYLKYLSFFVKNDVYRPYIKFIFCIRKEGKIIVWSGFL